MSLIVLWMTLASAQAGTAVWLGGSPDPSLTPGDSPKTAVQVAAAPVFGDADAAAVENLAAELAACRPLLDEFDGELAILQRLSRALDAVEMVRADDVDVVWQALLLEGLAVHRYFPDVGVPEATRAGAVRKVAGRAENQPWLDAIALRPDRILSDLDMPDEASRLAFQELRARVFLLAPVSVRVTHLPDGAALVVDGSPATGDRARMLPGLHRITVEVDGRVHMRETRVLAPGAAEDLAYRAVGRELLDLAEALAAADTSLALPAAVVTTLNTLDGPVSLVVEGKRGPRRFVVEGGVATEAKVERARESSDGPALVVSGGLGWVYDGDYLLQNAAAGAPETAATVNAASGVVGVGGEVPLGPVVVGAGADVVAPFGDWHTLPSGDQEHRLRLHPHAVVGWGPLRATVGWWSPWHVAAGLRGTVPLGGGFGLTGAYVHGFGIARTHDTGETFTPAASRVGWVGATWRWGGQG